MDKKINKLPEKLGTNNQPNKDNVSVVEVFVMRLF
jgi:hypothetical protein